MVDWDPNATQMHPDNTFNIARWKGNDDDSQLFDLINFLKGNFINIILEIYFLIFFFL